MTRLRRLLGQHPRLYGWLAADLVVLAAYGVCRGNRAWMNAFASQVTGPLKEALGRLCYHMEISVMEVLAAALVKGHITAEQAFDAANLEELWQSEHWGRESTSEQRRQDLKRELHDIEQFLRQ